MPESEAMDLDHLFGVDPNGMTEPPYPRPSHPPGSVPNGSGSSQANFATDPREPWAAQPPPPQGRSRSNPGYPRRGSAPAEYDRRVRGLDEFMHHVSGQPTDNYRPPVDRAWGIEMRDPADPDSLYQRAREQHGSSQPVWVWIAAAFILVIGSFGAGFLIVQPFVRSAPPELPPVPESQP